MQGQQGNTGVQNPHYNLVSVMYHALNGAETYEQYARDAEQSGDQELAQFFHQVYQQASSTGQQAMQLLVQRVGQGGQSGMGQSSTR